MKNRPVLPTRFFVPMTLLAATGLLVLLASCRPSKPQGDAISSRDIHAEIAAHEGEIVGNAACQSCHPNECRVFASGAHANTLHNLDARTPRLLAPPEGRILRTPFTIHQEGERYMVEAPAGTGEAVSLGGVEQPYTMPLQVVFGSGSKGVAYATDMGGDRMFCLRYSYLPGKRRWHAVGSLIRQYAVKSNEPGAIRTDGVRMCIGCHAVKVPDDKLFPPPQEMGVGCESCHGPGGAHVVAMQRRLFSEPHIDSLQNLAAARVQNACAKCHRLEDNIDGLPWEVKHGSHDPDRGHPTAIEHSRCYQESQGKLSCVSCHDPHADLSTDIPKYEAICLRCHSERPPADAVAAEQAVAAHICPVNSRSGCIRCHMPQHEMFPEFDEAATLTSHYIGIYRKRAAR